MHDINDAGQVRQAQQREKRRASVQSQALLAVMDTEDGRAVLRGVIGAGDLMSSGYVRGPDAEREMAYLAGRRSVALDVLDQINREMPELGELMMREAHEAEKREREEAEAAEIDTEAEQPGETDGTA